MLGNKSTVRHLYIINNESISVGFQDIVVGFAHDLRCCFFDVVNVSRSFEKKERIWGILKRSVLIFQEGDNNTLILEIDLK